MDLTHSPQTTSSNMFRRFLKNETLQSVVILALSLLIFLSTPLLNISDGYYSPADLTQSFTFTQLESGHVLSNIAINDVAVTFHPWFMYVRDNIWAGKLPLWNPYNGKGVPFLGNYTSSIFSPYLLPFYLLPFKQALIVAAFLRLFFIGFFTLLFLKKLKVRQLPALVGAIAFMYCGPNIFFLSGVNTAVTFVLPASLYFVECIFYQFEQAANLNPKSNRRLYYFWYLVGLSLSLLCGLLASHAETFVFCFILLGAYIVFRLITLWWKKSCDWQQIGLLVLQLCGAGIMAALLAAIQLIPFFEYLANSTQATGRSEAGGNFGIPFEVWPLLTFPYLVGDPASSTYRGLSGPLSFYYVMGFLLYIGSFVLFLALLSLRYIRKNKYIAFFAGILIPWVIYTFNIFGLGGLAKLIPGLSMVPVWRSQPIFLFCVSCCAAFFLNELYELKPAKADLKRFRIKSSLLLRSRFTIRLEINKILPVLIGFLGIGFLLLFIVGATDLIKTYKQYIVILLKAFQDYVPNHVLILGFSFGAGLLFVLGFWLTRYYWQKTVLSGLILLVVFLQGGYLLKDFNPTIKEEFFYPVTPAIQSLKQVVGNQTLAILGGDSVLSSVNLHYQLAMPINYDSLYIRYYSQLGDKFFGASWPGDIFTISEKALKLFGIEYYIHDYRKLFSLDTGLTYQQYAATNRYTLDPLLSNNRITQTFKAPTDDLRLVAFNFNNFNRINNCTIQIKLAQLPEEKAIYEGSYSCQQLSSNPNFQFSFPPIANSKDEIYRLTFTSPDAQPDNNMSLWAKADLNYSDGNLQFDGQPKAGGLEFDFYTGNPDNFQLVTTIKGRPVYKYLNTTTNYFTVDKAIFADADKQTLKLVLRSEFDPARMVILSNSGEKETDLSSVAWEEGNKATLATVLKEESTSILLKVERKQPGYMVLSKSFFPGWKAKVNGVEKPVLRANYAFSAVELGTGESIVQYYYDPISFKFGSSITISALVIGLLLSIGCIWLRRRKLDQLN